MNQECYGCTDNNIHPSIKLLSIIIISSFIGQTGWSGIFLTLFLLLPFYSTHWEYYKSAINMLLRIKWLLISIIILYLFLLPTETIQHHNFTDLYAVFPVLYRVSILCVIIFSVNLLLKTTDKNQIISGVALLIYPLTKMGVDLDSFLVRTYLTIDFVGKLNTELRNRKNNRKTILPFILSWLENSVHNKTDKIIIERLRRPDLLQWFIPILLCFCYIFLLYHN